MFFLSTAPSLFTSICQNLAAAELVTPGARVVLEKPLGKDRASAEQINESVGSIFSEKQIYRIDHYLGKEAVQNLLALRFGNALFEPLWRRGRIVHVQITVGEELGVEGRGAVLRHRPARCATWCRTICCSCCASWHGAAGVQPSGRGARREAQGAARAATARSARRGDQVVRGQYKAGAVHGHRSGYLEENEIAPDSTTETFVALKADIDTWRWAGVPFYLRTGKRLQDRLTDSWSTFEDVPHSIFERASTAVANRLVIRLQPAKHHADACSPRTRARPCACDR